MSEHRARLAVGDLVDFLDASPSPWHAVESTIDARLRPASSRIDEADDWTEVPTAGYVVRDGALIAWRLPDGATDPALPFRIVGAHTDSPCLRVKPRPDSGSSAGGNSASRSTAASSSTPGSTATSASPAA